MYYFALHPLAPVPQSKVKDYDPYSQGGLFNNYDIKKQYFLAKGHLTPNADFNTDDERLLTMITTNIAPQWQKLTARTGKKWRKVYENAQVLAEEIYTFLLVWVSSEPSVCQCICQQFPDLRQECIF